MIDKKIISWLNSGSVKIPTDFEGLKFWYDIDQIEGLNNDDEITTLSDLSGNSATLTPSSSFWRPIYKTNILNGKPVARFSDSESLVGAKAKFDFMHSGDTTIFFVVSSTLDNVNQYLFDSANNSTANIGRSIYLATTAKLIDQCYNGTSGQTVYNVTLNNNDFPKDVFHIVVCRYEEGKSGDDAEVYIDNILEGSNTGTQAPTATTSTGLPTFGVRSNLGSGPYYGDFVEWFGYNRALSDSEIAQLVGGIQSTYGL